LGAKWIACGEIANALYGQRLATGANRLPRSETRDAHHRADVSAKRERRTGQTAISLTQLRRTRRIGFPSPHHAAGSLAPVEVPPHLVMQAREKHPVQHVSDAGSGSCIDAIKGKLLRIQAKPDHGAPPFHHGVFFGHEHWKILPSHDDQMTASIDARAGSPSKPAKAFLEVFFARSQLAFTAFRHTGLETLQLKPRKIRESGLRATRKGSQWGSKD
jgi:hypothetical protein